MTLTRIEPNTSQSFNLTSTHILWSSQLVLFSIIGLFYLFEWEINGELIFIIAILMIIPFGTLIYSHSEFFPNKHSAIGVVILGDKSIKLTEGLFEYNYLNDLKFDISDYKGEKIRFPSRVYSAGPSLSQGINNYIEFQYNSQIYKIQFQIHTKLELENLGIIIKSLYKNNILFKETFKGSKSYGLRHLNYKEIQEFKKENIC
ncbi:MAG: hypothetical protein IPL31_01225 [Saprospiraceae bacterium]|nr:hypothetical protein [Saprospiraceae bacterium]